MRIAVISDTHAPRRWSSCPAAVAAAIEGVDLILHAGDICTPDVLEELSTWAPVKAVRGNNDGDDIAAWGAPETLELDLAGIPIAMIHDSGPATGRARRMALRFPGAAIVVFGHSHIPWCEATGSQVLFNPGSPTDRRRQPHGTLGFLTIEDGTLLDASIVPVT